MNNKRNRRKKDRIEFVPEIFTGKICPRLVQSRPSQKELGKHDDDDDDDEDNDENTNHQDHWKYSVNGPYSLKKLCS